MDRVTIAIDRAVRVQCKGGNGGVQKKYKMLKAILQDKFGHASPLMKAIESHEREIVENYGKMINQATISWVDTTNLDQEVKAAKAGEDEDVQHAVDALLKSIEIRSEKITARRNAALAGSSTTRFPIRTYLDKKRFVKGRVSLPEISRPTLPDTRSPAFIKKQGKA
jgi:hypothetical protein